MIGDLRIHKKSILNNMSKQELIEAIEILEHNYIAVNEQYVRAIDINTELVALLKANKIEWLELFGTRYMVRKGKIINLKLPKKKHEPKHNDELRKYVVGWNRKIVNAKCLCKIFGYEYAKERLLEAKKIMAEKVIMPYYKGQYDCILEIMKLNEVDNE